jgi:hypothetical protein
MRDGGAAPPSLLLPQETIMHRTNENGRTLLEMLFIVAILLILAAVTVPSVKAYSIQVSILSAGRKFKAEFWKARTDAIRSGEYRAIRFEGDTFSVYRDGDRDGVRADDISAGRDTRVAGPFVLASGASGVRVGINPGVKAIPPDSGMITGDPIKFGTSHMVSFSPVGGATPGTFYLAGQGVQGAVRVNGTTGRVRLMIWRGQWTETP